MAIVTKCDICGDDIKGTDCFKIKGFLLKKKEFDWDGSFWRKIDICNECQINLIHAARARKENLIREDKK